MIVAVVGIVAVALTRILVAALFRPTGPVTINAQGAVINVSQAPLPPAARPRASVPAKFHPRGAASIARRFDRTRPLEK